MEPMKPVNGHCCVYSVWNNQTDELVAAYATAEECARRMGLTMNGFRAAKRRKKWYIKTYLVPYKQHIVWVDKHKRYLEKWGGYHKMTPVYTRDRDKAKVYKTMHGAEWAANKLGGTVEVKEEQG